MKTCDEIEMLISLDIDGMLSPDEQNEINEHIGVCGECRERLKLLREVVSAVQSVPQIDLPEGFHEEIMKKITHDGSETVERRFREKRQYFRRYTLIAASVLVGFIMLSGLIGGVSLASARLGASSKFFSSNQNEAAQIDVSGFDSPASNGADGSISFDVSYGAEDAALALPESALSGAAPMREPEMDTAREESASSQNMKSFSLDDAAAYSLGGASALELDLFERRYSISIKVEDFEYAVRQIDTLVGDNTSSSVYYDGGTGRASYVKRVEFTDYDYVIEVLRSVGEVEYESETETKLTSSWLDTQALLAAKTQESSRLFELLSGSATMNTMIMIERQLENVEHTRDNYTATLNSLSDRSSRAYVEISLTGVSQMDGAEAVSFTSRMNESFDHSISSTSEGLGNLLVFLSGVLIPLLILVVVVLIIFVVVRRNSRKGGER